MKITTASEIGKRSYQEDQAIVIRKDCNTLLAVMDGHSGSKTAEIIMQHLEQIFVATRKQYPRTPKKLLFAVFEQLNCLTANEESGSTLSVVLVPRSERRAHVAILGDSPVVVKNPDQEAWVGPEHNARTNLREREAALSRGASYNGGYLHDPNSGKGLQMSRSLGDVALHTILSRIPEVFSVPIEKGSAIIVMSDGVVDPVHQEPSSRIERLLKIVAEDPRAAALVDDALQRGARDNITAVLCTI